MESESLHRRAPVRWLTVTAVFMAMNIALSSFGIPVPGGHLYLNDIVICTAAILLDPLGAFAVGGIGAGFVPEVLDTAVYDEIIPVSNEDAFAAGRQVGRKEG